MGTSEAAIETAEKRGYDTGLRCGTRSCRIATFPVWIANFVLMEYGTGAIFGCPAHDQRDLDFARKYGLAVVPVVVPAGEDAATFSVGGRAYDGAGADRQFRASLTGCDIEAAKRAAIDGAGAAGWGRRGELAAARLGRQPAALLGLPDPGHPLRAPAASCRCRTASCRCSCRTT